MAWPLGRVGAHAARAVCAKQHSRGRAGGARSGAQRDPAPQPHPVTVKTRKISAAGIARIKAAQKVRWAKYNEGSAEAEPVRVKKFTMSAAAKAKISAAAKARWARVRARKPASAVAPKKKKFTMSAAAKAKISAAAKARWAKVKAAK